jgi:hypothetical protein
MVRIVTCTSGSEMNYEVRDLCRSMLVPEMKIICIICTSVRDKEQIFQLCRSIKHTKVEKATDLAYEFPLDSIPGRLLLHSFV